MGPQSHPQNEEGGNRTPRHYSSIPPLNTGHPRQEAEEAADTVEGTRYGRGGVREGVSTSAPRYRPSALFFFALAARLPPGPTSVIGDPGW